MNVDFPIYIAQPRPGHYRACIPHVTALAEPVEGASPAALKEELMFRALALVHGSSVHGAEAIEPMPPARLAALIPPDQPRLVDVTVDIGRRRQPERPPDTSADPPSIQTHVVAAKFDGDTFFSVWIPSTPGQYFRVERIDQLDEATNTWAAQWVGADGRHRLSTVETAYPARLESLGVDLGFPRATPHSGDGRPADHRRRQRPVALAEVATNLTHRAADDTLKRAYGRHDLVDELVEAMCASTPANLCLIGPSGAGKTAIIDEAAHQTYQMQTKYQQRRDVWRTSADRIVAGLGADGPHIANSWQQRADALCHELAGRGDILVLDDLLGMVRAGPGATSLAGFIEPYLDQHQFSVIAEATEASFDTARAEADGFVERFRPVRVHELNWDQTLAVVTDLSRALEARRPVRFTPDAIETVLGLSRRFFRQQAFPGKPVRLVRRCVMAASKRLSADAATDAGSKADTNADNNADANRLADAAVGATRHARIDPTMVAQVVHRQTNLPLRLLVAGRGRRPDQIERAFCRRVFDQPDAADAVTSLVAAIEQGLTDPTRPLGSLLLIGPSGVGKTETAKTVAVELFGGRDRLVRFDMTEFSQPGAAGRLIGTTADPDGELTGRVHRQPCCVVLFDEVEKAHSTVLNLLLQLLDDARLTDAAGRRVDFANTVVLMTSNLGADLHGVGQMSGERGGVRDRRAHYADAARAFFRPEFFDRIDRLVAYRPLAGDTLGRIARRAVADLVDRRGLRHAHVMVDVDRRVIDHLVDGVADRRYGARTLADRVEQRLVTPLARALVDRGSLDRGSLDRGSLDRASGDHASNQPDDIPTRAAIRLDHVEGAGNDDHIDLRLIELRRARRADDRPLGVALFVDQADGDSLAGLAERLRTRFGYLVDAARTCHQSGRRAEIDAQYDAALETINARAASGADVAHEVAERLRQIELFRDQFRQFRNQLEALLDPDRSADITETDIELPEFGSFDPPKLHRFSQDGRRLFGRLTWVRRQMDALAQDTADSATLVIDGLSGQTGPILAHWRHWLDDFADRFDVNLAWAHRAADGWRPLADDGPVDGPIDIPVDAPIEARSTLAASAEHPAISAAFERLSGYMWAPTPPSHGRHGLVVVDNIALSTTRAGTSDTTTLVERLVADTPTRQLRADLPVEYILRQRRLDQLRVDRRRSVPEPHEDAADFMSSLIFERLAIDE